MSRNLETQQLVGIVSVAGFGFSPKPQSLLGLLESRDPRQRIRLLPAEADNNEGAHLMAWCLACRG